VVPLQKKKDDDEEDEAKQQVPRMYLTFKGRSSPLPGSLVPRLISSQHVHKNHPGCRAN